MTFLRDIVATTMRVHEGSIEGVAYTAGALERVCAGLDEQAYLPEELINILESRLFAEEEKARAQLQEE